MRIKFAVTALLIVGLTGCATTSVQDADKPKAERTKIAANMQEVKLTSSPEGASCDVTKDGESMGTLASTPGFVTIRRSNFKSVDVTCSKPGYTTNTEVLRTIAMDKSIDGNIGAAVTLFKMAQGSVSSYENSLFIKLTPASFASLSERDAYLADETAILNADFQSGSAKYLTCKKKKCVKKMAELQTAYDAKLSKLKSDTMAIPVQ